MDTLSVFLDYAIDKAKDSNIIDQSIAKTIKSEKNTIIKNIKSDISENLNNQVKYIEKIDEYNNRWYDAFNNQDLSGMRHSLNFIQKYMENVLPIENTLKEARKIESIHNLVENKGNFDISIEELELIEVFNNS